MQLVGNLVFAHTWALFLGSLEHAPVSTIRACAFQILTSHSTQFSPSRWNCDGMVCTMNLHQFFDDFLFFFFFFFFFLLFLLLLLLPVPLVLNTSCVSPRLKLLGLQAQTIQNGLASMLLICWLDVLRKAKMVGVR